MTPPPNAGLKAALAILALTLAAACGGSPTTTAGTASVTSDASSSAAPGDLPAGWTRVNVEAAGYSLAIPDDWVELSADDLDAAGGFDTEGLGPDMAAIVEQAQ